MIVFDKENNTYTCPFCNESQSFYSSCGWQNNRMQYDNNYIPEGDENAYFTIYTLQCTNKKCKKKTVIAINRTDGKQIDIVPQNIYKHFPEYIPKQIRDDYEEASQIIDISPKAAATLLRRCLQGMIRDFWCVRKGRLVDEIDEIKDRITPFQWKAIEGLRHIGNIGAHMEKDVNLIIDVEPDEANKLLQLIELLLEKWYISRHEEDELCKSIVAIADKKESERKTNL